MSDRRCAEPECVPLPAALRGLLDWQRSVFGNFLVCPFTRARPGVMQFVCIERATRLRQSAVSSH